MTQSGKERKLEMWKQGLLDVSRRNKMINYRRTRRGSLQLLSPDYATLFDRLVDRGESLTFKRAEDCSGDPQIGSLLFLMNQMGHPIEITTGEIGTSLSLEESCRTLKNLRTKARLSQEEQGINILYLSFGFLEWKRNPSEQPMRAPLVLVPVSLATEALNSPWKLSRLGVEAPPRCASADIPPVRARMLPARAERAAHLENAARWGGAEEVVVNPTLAYVLSSEFGMELPEFGSEHSVCQPRSGSENADATCRAHSKLEAYLAQVEAVVSPFGWKVIREVDLALLSFLKIVMYEDLEKNRERILAHPVVRAFCGDLSGLPSPSLQPVGRYAGEGCGYMHDEEPPLDTWQVVDADSSQMDAIRLSKEGYSFVLQGPPGTGKSQTITNIIAQGLADGKRILFVSEKMAALSVVYRRLQEVQLDGTCLSLHNYRADKKEVLANLATALDAPGQKLKTGVLDFAPEYAAQRKELNGYFTTLHTLRKPLGRTLYDVLTELCTLEQVPLCGLSEPVMEQSGEEYRLKLAALQRYQEFLDNYAQQSPAAQREGRRDRGGRSGRAGCGRQQQPIIDENIHSGADAFAGDGQQHQSINENPWRDSHLGAMTYDLRMSISQTLSALEPELAALLAFRDFLWKKESRAAKKRFTMDFRDWKWKDYTDFIQSAISAKLLEAAGQIDGKYSDKNDSFAEECWKLVFADDHKGLPAEIWEKTFALAVSQCKKEFDHWLSVYEKTLIDGKWIPFWIQKEQKGKAGETDEVCEKGEDSEKKEASETEEDSEKDKVSVKGEDREKGEDNEKKEEGKIDKASEMGETNTAGEVDDLPGHLVRCHQQLCRGMSQAAECRRKLEAESEKLSEIFSFVCCVNREIHMEYHSVRDGLERIRRIVRILLIPCNYRLAWVTEYGLEKVRTLARTVEELAASEKAQALNLRTEWKDEFLNLDGETLLRRFSRESTSFLGRLGSRYRADRELLISMRKPSATEPYSTSFRSANIPRDASRRGLNDCPQDDQSPRCASDKKLEDAQLRAGLELLAAYQKAKKELEEKSREAKLVLIGHYRGADTDWVKLYQDLDACEEIEVYQKKYGITPELKKLLENRYDTRRYVRLNGKWVEELSDGKWFDACERVLEPYKNAPSPLLWSASDAFASQERTEEDIPAILEHLKQQTALLKSLEDAWNALLKTVQKSALPEPLAAFTAWFSKDLLSELTLEELYERVKDCRDLEQLNSWLLYRSILDDCEEKGLGVVIANAQKNPETVHYIANAKRGPETARYIAMSKRGIDNIEAAPSAADQEGGALNAKWETRTPEPYRDSVQTREPGYGLPAIYRKSFLTKWALHWLNSEEMRPFALFQSYSHENLIARFRENDRRLIELTRIRLNEKLSAQRPSGNQLIVNGRDELAILRRETEKKAQSHAAAQAF